MVHGEPSARPGLVVLAGPTASGKSDLALRLAERTGGVVINADALQLYRDLSILTARPGPSAMARAPHRLYGVLAGDEPGSAGVWLERMRTVLREAAESGRTPIVAGGTGFYIEALLQGLAPVPDIPADIRGEVRALGRAEGASAVRQALAVHDPVMAGTLPPTDAQRLMRALEVVRATGRTLAWWQAQPRLRLDLPAPVRAITLMPPRAILHARIASRFDAMLADGALEEVRALTALGLPEDAPVMKAVGVPELRAVLKGAIGWDQARERAVIASRRYAKRQVTWLRHRSAGFARIEAFGEEVAAGEALAGHPATEAESRLSPNPR
ncbi:tRNA (adenosine(37)-N6)-dimethylallyltransferase MiaA [Marinivivus vitaminiproducens]|uniref:tRNA (adenosine(37)-N6)-dimethylallyltransferase MiaA n=1 Tax=Marinivivus vitaminiproducens TaxID=3035935 RepID=UPI0027A91F3F|nr:tRNA (adenosine(37)-N6)-dimethylallyltransferase MiaA [Geminicoccaceae bacterium SCSIO 64248]